MFDLGGVVIDIDFNRAFTYWAEHANDDPDRIAALFSQDNAYMQHERGEIHYIEYFNHLRRTLDVSLSDTHFEKGWNSIYVGVIEGIRDVIDSAKDRFPLYVFTNTNLLHQSFWDPNFGDLLTHFEKVYASPTLGMRKPEARAFNYIAKDIGHPPSQILFFDDLKENVMGAQSAGFQAVEVRSVEDVKAALSDL